MIFVEDNTIKLNGVVLPGLVKSIEVKESAQIDEQEVEGSSTKPKQATGYEDAKINIELVVDDTDTQTKYQRLETLRAVFRKEGQGVPQPIPARMTQSCISHPPFPRSSFRSRAASPCVRLFSVSRTLRQTPW